MPVGLPVVGLVDVDERDDEVEGVTGWVEARVSGDAVQCCGVQARVLDVGGSYQVPLMLGDEGCQENDDVERCEAYERSAGLEAVPDCRVQ